MKPYQELGAAGGILLIVINKLRERGESVENESIIESDLSVQMLSPITKRACYVRMIVLGLYLNVERKRCEPRDHGWNGRRYRMQAKPAMETPHPDANNLPLLMNSIKLRC
jgi:hypothetical protein